MPHDAEAALQGMYEEEEEEEELEGRRCVEA